MQLDWEQKSDLYKRVYCLVFLLDSVKKKSVQQLQDHYIQTAVTCLYVMVNVKYWI